MGFVVVIVVVSKFSLMVGLGKKLGFGLDSVVLLDKCELIIWLNMLA